MLNLLLYVLVAAACYVTSTEACSCFPAHPQVKFCQAKFAIKVRVLEERLFFRNGHNFSTDPAFNFAIYRYKVRVQQIFKGKEFFPSKTAFVFTRGNSALCGVRIPIIKRMIFKNTWLFTGSISDGRPYIGACNWLSRYYDLTVHQRVSLKTGRYQRGCACVNNNGQLACQVPNNFSNKRFCYDRFSTCKRGLNSSCRWTKSFGLIRCCSSSG